MVFPFAPTLDVLQRVGIHPASCAVELTPRVWKTLFADDPPRRSRARTGPARLLADQRPHQTAPATTPRSSLGWPSTTAQFERLHCIAGGTHGVSENGVSRAVG